MTSIFTLHDQVIAHNRNFFQSFISVITEGDYAMAGQRTVTFQEALDIVESLPESQQEDLINIIRRRRQERHRDLLAKHIKQARAESARGEIKRGAVDDLMKELERGHQQEDDILLLEIMTHDEVY